ncbi:hypothetical protein NMG60_11006493 [Bertholletia excelsa]
MVEPSPSRSADRSSSCMSITDLDVDSLVHCAAQLNLRDILSMAMSCKYLRTVAYSDSIWQRVVSRKQRPEQISSSFPQASSVREAYPARRTALQKFKFIDPLVAGIPADAKPFDHLILNRGDIISSQGSLVHVREIDGVLSGRESLVTLSGHHAKITCIRLFPLNETSLFRSEIQQNDSALVTSSSDHTIRLWWKGSCLRCFRGHKGPVSILSDKLLGDGDGKIFASGGVDTTIRLWSLGSRGKRGQQALKATLFGHGKPVVLMSVAGDKTSHLVSMSKNSELRVWDTTVSSAVRSSCCVGISTVPGTPVGMKCHESMVYVAAGSSIVGIDLRTMQRAFVAAIRQSEIHSFEMMPSQSLICTGGTRRAMLWDIRQSRDAPKLTKPVSELGGHRGAVTHLHMDPCKIVTGGPEDSFVNVWETSTGMKANSLTCCFGDALNPIPGCSAMAVNRYQIATASCGEQHGCILYRDFQNATWESVTPPFPQGVRGSQL